MEAHCDADSDFSIDGLKEVVEVLHRIILDNKAAFIIRGFGGNPGGNFLFKLSNNNMSEDLFLSVVRSRQAQAMETR